jgi:hypothetical protein
VNTMTNTLATCAAQASKRRVLAVTYDSVGVIERDGVFYTCDANEAMVGAYPPQRDAVRAIPRVAS